MSAQARGYLAIVFAAALWGLSGVTAKFLFSTTTVAPFLLVQVRMGLSFLILLATLALVRPGLLRIGRGENRFLALWGIGGMAMVQFTYFLTISETNVATAIFLQYLAPILVALWSWLAEGQRPGPLLLACLAMAVAGSMLLIFGGSARLLVSPLGLASGLASAVFMSFYTIYGSRGVGRLSPWTLLCYGLGFGFGFWLLVDAGLLAAGRPLPDLAVFSSPRMWGFFFYIASLATVVPFGLYLSGLRSVSPTKATITGMLEPVIGGAASYLLLGERLQSVQMMGGALIVAAVILLQSRRQQPTGAQATG